jgi:hypothetical protein
MRRPLRERVFDILWGFAWFQREVWERVHVTIKPTHDAVMVCGVSVYWKDHLTGGLAYKTNPGEPLTDLPIGRNL